MNPTGLDSSFSAQTLQAYERARNKLREYRDNDPYALQRFDYIINKHLKIIISCFESICGESEDRTVFDISNAILKADPTKAYWQALKSCEDTRCAVNLVGELPSYNDHTDGGQPTDAANADSTKDTGEREAKEQSSPQNSALKNSVNKSSAPALNTIETQHSNGPNYITILFTLGFLVAVAVFGFFARRKCPACGKRGTLTRNNRTFLNETPGTRIKTVEEKTDHHLRDKKGYSGQTGHSVTHKKITVATLVLTYRDTYRCKNCGHEFSENVNKTRDA